MVVLGVLWNALGMLWVIWVGPCALFRYSGCSGCSGVLLVGPCALGALSDLGALGVMGWAVCSGVLWVLARAGP